MKSIQTKFIHLLNAALNHQKLSAASFSYNELRKLQLYAHVHGLEALIFSAFELTAPLAEKSTKLMKEWENIMVRSSLRQKMNDVKLQQVLQAFIDAHLPIIPLKGVYLRMLYPLPELRTMGDADLLIHYEDYRAVHDLLLSLGYTEVPDEHAYHKAFTKPNFPLIEVHWALTNGHSFNASAVEIFQQQVWGHALLSSVGALQTLSFSHEDTCIYLIIHMAKHLKYAGFGLRQICDLYLLLKQYGTVLKWHYIQKSLKEMGLYPFFSLLLTTLHTLFEVPLSIPLEDLPVFKPSVAAFFISELFQSGLFGSGFYSHGVSSLLIHGEETTTNQPTKTRDYIFPPSAKLKAHYAYCKKLPVLLPVAWLHYIGNLLFRSDISFSSKLQVLLTCNQNKKRRLQLFKSLEL